MYWGPSDSDNLIISTVRKLMDCLIASVAIRAGMPILHNDTDFDTLALHTGLQVYVT